MSQEINRQLRIPEQSNLEKNPTNILSKRTNFFYAFLLVLFTPFMFFTNFFSTNIHYSFSFFSPLTIGAIFLLSWSFFFLFFIKLIVFFLIIQFINKKIALSGKNLVFSLFGILLFAHVLFYSASLLSSDLNDDRLSQELKENVLEDIKIGDAIEDIENYLNSQADIDYQKIYLIKFDNGQYDFVDYYEGEDKLENIGYYLLSYAQTNRHPLSNIYFKDDVVVEISDKHYKDKVPPYYEEEFANQLFD